MEIAPGRHLGPYEIVSRIGAGGMGEVWRGRDTRLDRSVAIKILPTDLASNEQFKTRFEREAKMISQLNHPNICTLYDVGHDSGTDFLVMELLEGESLADRLTKGPLPLHEVLRCGQQIADALDRAHRQGVIHRDLKPGNIMLTKSGAKLLDFGLAKIALPEVSMDGATAQKPLTREGTIVGTFQYMSPEQLEGEDADPRTDIFSLGAVLYEMATGHRAFDGKTKTSLIAAIVSAQPQPVSQLQPLAPPSLDHIIHKCLEKDRDDRWQSAHDIAEELKWVASAGSQAGVAAPVVSRRKRRELALYVAIALLAAATGTLAYRLTKDVPSTVSYRTSIVLPSNPNYRSGAIAISPDGSAFVYSAPLANGEQGIWLRKFGDAKPQALAGTEGGAAPFWSRDGRFIGYFGLRSLMKVAAAGGQPEALVGVSEPGGGTWNESGVILFAPSRLGPIYRTSSGGGEAKAVTDPKSLGHRTHFWPSFLPDQKHFLFLALPIEGSKAKPGLWVGSLDASEKPVFVVASDSNGAYVNGGYLLYARDGVLRAQRFNPRKAKVEGDAISLTPVQQQADPPSAYFAASESGALLYVEQGSEELSRLEWVDRKGNRLAAIGDKGYYWSPRLSRDDKRVVLDRSESSGNGDIWVLETEREGMTRLTFDPANESSPVWSHDNRSILFFIESGKIVAKVAMISATGGETQLLAQADDYGYLTTDLSPDGQTLALTRYAVGGIGMKRDVALLSLATKSVASYVTSPFNAEAATFSPDGHWIAYVSDESGKREVYVQSNPTGKGKFQISNGGGVQPCWSADGDELLFVSVDAKLMSVAVETGAEFRAAVPVALFPVSLRESWVPQYDLSKDGSRLLLNSIVPRSDTPMTFISDWRRLFVQE